MSIQLPLPEGALEFDHTALEGTQAQIAQACDEIKELLLSKNKSYGDSAINPVRIFSKASHDEQLKVRLDDKLSRIARGNVELEDEDVLLDLIGYLILLMVAQRG